MKVRHNFQCPASFHDNRTFFRRSVMRQRRTVQHEKGFDGLRCYSVNACVILRPDNFDPPFVLCFLPVNTLQSSLSRLFFHTADRCGPPPCGRSSPPGHSVVDGWRRDERTRDIPQSPPRSLVSSAKPTTGVQVVRSAAPSCLDSLTPDAHRAGPLYPRPPRFASRPTPARLAPG